MPATFRHCSHCGARITPNETPPDAGSAVGSSTAPQGLEGTRRNERRHVTVLFADVSGFTHMSDRLDPEQVHEVMNECFAGLGRSIQEEGGYIDKYIGDNVMALFGAPVAHEDDPTR